MPALQRRHDRLRTVLRQYDLHELQCRLLSVGQHVPELYHDASQLRVGDTVHSGCNVECHLCRLRHWVLYQRGRLRCVQYWVRSVHKYDRVLQLPEGLLPQQRRMRCVFVEPV